MKFRVRTDVNFSGVSRQAWWYRDNNGYMCYMYERKYATVFEHTDENPCKLGFCKDLGDVVEIVADK